MAVLFAATSAFAAIWQSSWTANNDGIEFWDHQSWDGVDQNIGYLLSSSGYSYYVNSDGTAVKDFYYNNLWGTGQPYTTADAILKFEIAGYSGSNEFGYYDINTGVMTSIFIGGNVVNDEVTFNQLSKYGFYIKSLDGIWYTESSKNVTGQTNDQHFAVFKESPDVRWIGMEDLAFYSAIGAQNSDYDYNDMIVRINFAPTSVPEPTTLMLLGLGLVGLAGVRRKLKK